MTAMIDVPNQYHYLIEWIGDGTGLPDTILHIHAGMAVLILARLLTGRSMATFIPFGWVLIAETGNEILDRLHFGSWRWPDTISDLINTLFWPLALSLAIWARPILYTQRKSHLDQRS